MKQKQGNYTGSIPKCTRTFKCWLIELRKLGADKLPDLNFDRAKMFYNGGYSPKMVILEELRIPVGWESI